MTIQLDDIQKQKLHEKLDRLSHEYDINIYEYLTNPKMFEDIAHQNFQKLTTELHGLITDVIAQLFDLNTFIVDELNLKIIYVSTFSYDPNAGEIKYQSQEITKEK